MIYPLLIRLLRQFENFPMLEILGAFLKTGSGSVVSLLLNIASVKIMAVILGPSGLGLLSLLRQIQQTALNVATAGGQTALVQGASSRKDEARQDYLRTTLLIFLVGGLIAAGSIVLFAPAIAKWVIGKSDPSSVWLIRWLALPVLISVFSGYIAGVLNVYRAIGRLAIMQSSAALGILLLAYPVALAVKSGFELAFIGLMTASVAIGAGLGIVFLWQEGWLSPILRYLTHSIQGDAVRHFFSVAGTMVITGLVATGTMLSIRALIVRQQGLSGAGIFEAAWTVSMTYVMLILSSFSTYYLPTLTITQEPQARVILIQRLLRLSTLLMIPLVTAVVTLKPLVINLLFSNEFTPALEIMRWMLIGDYFKITSWVLAFPMLAYADMKTFFWSEIVSNVGFLGIAGGMIIGLRSLQGVGISFMLLYVAYLIYTLHYARSRYHLTVDRSLVITWLLGLALILGTSWQTWSATQVNWTMAVICGGAALALSWIMLGKVDQKQLVRLVLKKATQVRSFGLRR